MHINNEIGNILDINKVSDLTKKYSAYFHSDTVQSIGHYEMDLKKGFYYSIYLIGGNASINDKKINENDLFYF